MLPKKNSTFFLTKKKAQEDRKWYIFDATGKTLGRFASEVAKVLRGKHKVDFTPHVDGGDGVIIINADKIVVTGAKEGQKIYRYHTGAMSGLREVSYETMMERKPDYIVRHAVKGMLPRNRLTSLQLKRLRIFATGEEHGMSAQQPTVVNI